MEDNIGLRGDLDDQAATYPVSSVLQYWLMPTKV